MAPNAQLADKVHRALREIAEAATGADDLQALFGRLHEIIGGLLPARNFYVALYDEAANELSFPYFVDEMDPPPAPRPLGAGFTAHVVKTGRSLLLDSQALLERQRRGEETVGTTPHDWLGVPLISQHRTIGVLTVQDYTGQVHYSQQDRVLLEFVSGRSPSPSSASGPRSNSRRRMPPSGSRRSWRGRWRRRRRSPARPRASSWPT